MPDWLEPMAATLTQERFAGADWLFERKFDGIRLLAYKQGDEVRLYSRNRLPQNLPPVVSAVRALPVDEVILDGEMTWDGHSGYHVFDILWIDGEDVRSKPLRERKQLLKDTIDFHDPLRFTEHRNEGGIAYFQEACRKGWEGVIAKRADSPYSSKRSKDWLKFKCGHGQELVIGGFTEPRGTRIELGALLLGVYEGDRLRYAGKVGTGFDRGTLKELGAQLRARRRDTSPFADEVREKGTTWVEPELVAQIGFAEWTRDGRLRHPRFLGLREDKAARDVTREG